MDTVTNVTVEAAKPIVLPPIPTPGEPFWSRVTSRKFIQACFVQVSGAFALFMGKIDGGTYVALSTLALSIYGAASIADKKLNPTS